MTHEELPKDAQPLTGEILKIIDRENPNIEDGIGGIYYIAPDEKNGRMYFFLPDGEDGGMGSIPFEKLHVCEEGLLETLEEGFYQFNWVVISPYSWSSIACVNQPA